MQTPVVKLSNGSYVKEYCLIDEPEADGGGVEFWVMIQWGDIEPVHWWARALRWAVDWVLKKGM